MASIILDPNYGYVVLAAASTFILGIAHTANTGVYRKAAAVPYPLAYAAATDTSPAAFQFNCAQRAHANYVENQVQTVPALLIAGLVYPKTAAIMGAVWTVSRFMYMRGYSKGEEGGKGRYKKGGAAFWLPQLGLAVLSVMTGAGLVLGW